jgi:hypothetical protein
MPLAENAAHPMRHGERAVRHLNSRVSLSPKLANRLNNFGNASAMCRMIVAQSAPIGVNGQAACA